MSKFSKKVVLSAKDSISKGSSAIKLANEKMTKIAQDMETTGTAPDPTQVKEVLDSIADVAQEIVQQADSVSSGLESVVGDTEEIEVENTENETVVSTMNEEDTKRLEAVEEENKDLKEFKEKSEKEKMASDYSKLFPSNQQQAKFTEFMKMDKPNSELSTVLSATENVLTSVQKNASMGKTNETIIFTETNQKNASMQGFSGNANSLSEI